MNKSEELPVVIYTPESQIRTPGKLLRSMWRDLKASRELAWRLFVRDISAKYRQSLLGIFWAFLPPIVTGLIFIILQSKKILNLGETDIPYPVFVLVGTILWQTFTESLNAPLKAVTAAKPMLAKINFPRESLIISALYQAIFNFFIKCVILVGIFLIFGIQITSGLLLAPLSILLLILLGISFGLFLTPIGSLYRDISSGLMVLTQLWFFVTPVIYSPPQIFPYSLVATINPVSPLLIGSRDLLTKGAIVDIIPFLMVSFLTVFSLFIAWVVFRVTLPIIIERMSA